MQKVYTRKRSKAAVYNPFQKNNHDSLFFSNPKVTIPLFTLVSVLCTLFLLLSGDNNISYGGGVGVGGEIRQKLIKKSQFFKKRRRSSSISDSNENASTTTIKSGSNTDSRTRTKYGLEYEFPLSSFQNHNDPNLKTMTFTLPYQNNEEQTFQAYVQPPISTFYKHNSNHKYKNETNKKIMIKKQTPQFKGEAGKFFNLRYVKCITFFRTI